MIRHEVILRIKPGVPREMIDGALRDICTLIKQIQGVESVRSGANNSSAYRHAMLVVDLKDEIALHRFQRHPLHARAIRVATRMAESTAVGSYIVSPEHRG